MHMIRSKAYAYGRKFWAHMRISIDSLFILDHIKDIRTLEQNLRRWTFEPLI